MFYGIMKNKTESFIPTMETHVRDALNPIKNALIAALHIGAYDIAIEIVRRYPKVVMFMQHDDGHPYDNFASNVFNILNKAPMKPSPLPLYETRPNQRCPAMTEHCGNFEATLSPMALEFLELIFMSDYIDVKLNIDSDMRGVPAPNIVSRLINYMIHYTAPAPRQYWEMMWCNHHDCAIIWPDCFYLLTKVLSRPEVDKPFVMKLIHMHSSNFLCHYDYIKDFAAIFSVFDTNIVSTMIDCDIENLIENLSHWRSKPFTPEEIESRRTEKMGRYKPLSSDDMTNLFIQTQNGIHLLNTYFRRRHVMALLPSPSSASRPVDGVAGGAGAGAASAASAAPVIDTAPLRSLVGKIAVRIAMVREKETASAIADGIDLETIYWNYEPSGRAQKAYDQIVIAS